MEEALGAVPFVPECIAIFSGYDSHRDDCGADITDWTDDDFETLTRKVCALAHRSRCPVFSVHGGGYKVGVTVRAAERHVRTLLQAP